MYGYTPAPVPPQGAHYGYAYQPRPALTYQPAPLIAYPNATHHPSPSTYLDAPQNQFGGSVRSPTYGPPRSVASSPYINANSIQDWAHGVNQGNKPSPGSVRSDAQYVGSPSRRSEKHRDRNYRQEKEKSRYGSVYPPSYDYRTDDYKTDAGSRADGTLSRMDPYPNMIRREPVMQKPPPRRSYSFYATWGR